MNEIDRQTMRPAQASARPARPAGRHCESFEPIRRRRFKRVRARPRKTKPDQGSRGRQSSVRGRTVPRPSQTSAGGLKVGPATRSGAAKTATLASNPTRTAGATEAPPAGSTQRCNEECRRNRIVRRKEIGRQRQQRGRAADDRQPTQERGPANRAAMGERQRCARQRQKRVGHQMRKEPHRRRHRKVRRRQMKIGEIPTQMIDRHADQGRAPGDIDRRDARIGCCLASLHRAPRRILPGSILRGSGLWRVTPQGRF